MAFISSSTFHPTEVNDPTSRFSHCAAAVGGKCYLLGGFVQDFLGIDRKKLVSTVEIFDPNRETWKYVLTTGDPPPGLYDAACTSVLNSLYWFGGWDGKSFYNSLHRLDTTTLEWTELQPENEAEGPIRKKWCGMVSFSQDKLAAFGGYGYPTTSPIQSGATFIKNPFGGGMGWSNELHVFDITRSKWSSPPTTGTRPPPSYFFSFTAINNHQAVLFGGIQHDFTDYKVNDCFLMDFKSMHWTKLEKTEGTPWPVGRDSHAACCLNFGEEDPQLLVTGGVDNNGKTLSDAWILDVKSRRWRELTLHEAAQTRLRHTTTAISLEPGRTRVIMFGGCPKWLWGKPEYEQQELALTAVLEFESVQSSSSGGTPTIEWVLKGVIASQGLGTPERFEMRERKTEHDLQVQVEKALKKGYILMDLTTCLATGAPGSGKTHLRYLLYGLFPPALRISTACIEEAQRAVIGSLDSEDSEESQWKPVHSGGLKEMVAEGVSAGVEGLEEEILVSASHKPDTTPLKSDTTTQTHDAVIAVHDSGSQVTKVPASGDPQPQLQHRKEAVHAIQPSALVVKETVEANVPRMQAFELPETSDILKLMKSLSTSKQPLRAHWMHFIDSGGQPQFLEILPAFIRNVSLLLLLVKLSEELSDTPTMEYFSPDGKSYQLGVFPLSNEQLLVQAAQLSLFHQSQISLPHNIIEKEQSLPNITVVGTFADQESKCKETRSEKNNRLKQFLQPFQKQLIPRSKSEIIFPVNAKSAGQGKNEDPVATELRRVIQKLAPRLRMRFPLLWYFLEMELRRLGLKIVTKSECWEIAQKLGFESKEALEAALLYLHEANLFLYYPDVLSNTIFVDPQAVLTNITQLYERHIKLEDAPESEVVGEDDLRYRDQALFTVSALISLDTDYSKAAFPNEDLIILLQNRLIVSEMPFFIHDETTYFMPSLLPALEEGDIIQPKTTAASPLIISFQEGWAPTGLFCALVVSLLSRKSQLPWKISELVSGNMSKLYKNYLEFSIGYIAGSITLVNTMKQFELHPSSELPSDLLPLIWQTINHNLKEACSKYSYKVSHHFAFKCNCRILPPHTALISLEKSTVQCSRDPDRVEPLSSKQKLWGLFESDYAGMDKIEVKNQQIQTEIVKTVEQHVQVGSMAEQQAGMDEMEVKNQKIQTEIVKTVEQHVQVGSTAQQQAGSDKAEVKDQKVQTEAVEIRNQHVQADTTDLEQVVPDKVEVRDQKVQTETVEIRDQQDKVEIKHHNVQTETVEIKDQHVQTETIAQEQAHIRGVEVIAQETFTITQEAVKLNLEGYGFKLCVPENSLPAEVSETQLSVLVSLSGPFQMPSNCELASAVYWVSSTYKFMKPITVEIQHCAALSSSKQCSQLTFVHTKCTQKKLPYIFKEKVGGVFIPHSSYGSLSLSHFSGICIVIKSFVQRFFGVQSVPDQAVQQQSEKACQTGQDKEEGVVEQYCAQLYIARKSANKWKVDFVVTKDLDSCSTVVKKEYSSHGHPEFSFIFSFEKDFVSLTIPEKEKAGGWKISPCYHPKIMKQQVNCFSSGKSIPKCELLLRWSQKPPPAWLQCEIGLIGARDHSYFLLDLDPDLDIQQTTSPSLVPARQPSLQSASGIKELDEEDHTEITNYLTTLDKTHIYHLALVLGLSERRAESMKESATFLDKVVVAWLQKTDQVMMRGVPTWQRLVEALKDKTVGQNGIASTIATDKLHK